MKKLFWLGLIGLFLFEIANVYFIMPMPGSQDMNSIDLAYFLYTWRWLFRILFGVMIKKMVIDYPPCIGGIGNLYDQFCYGGRSYVLSTIFCTINDRH